MIRDLKKYEGTFFEAIDGIIEDGRRVASFLDIMKERLEGRLQNDAIVTGDAAIFLPDGSLKIDYDSRFLVERENLPGVSFNKGNASLNVNLENLGMINGPSFTFDQLINMDFDSPENNPVLLALSRYSNLQGYNGSVEPLLLKYINSVPHNGKGKIMTPLLDHNSSTNSNREKAVKKNDGIARIRPWIFSSIQYNSDPNGYCDGFCKGQTVVGKKYFS